VKNFVFGLLVGVVGTWWYLTSGGTVREAVDDWWARASAPPPSQRALPAQRAAR
jgi:hypothetical protein